MLEIDRDVLAPARQQVERRPRARVLAGAIDAKHLGAHVREHHPGERTGPDARDLDDSNT